MEEDKYGRSSQRASSEEDNYEPCSLSYVRGRRANSTSRSSTSSSLSASRDSFTQNSLVWNLFQDAAANTSRLYQARASGRDGHWMNFQNAASSISMLYKESLEAQQRSFDAGYRNGVEKAYNSLMDWLVQDPRYNRCKTIRVEDLVNFVYSPKNPATFESKVRAGKGHESSSSPAIPASLVSGGNADHSVSELEAFREALHVSSLNGAMSHFNVNLSPPRSSPSRSSRSVDLHAFVTEEIRRHKRTNQDMDRDEEFDDDSNPYKRTRYSPSK